jgi:hypothetical protein
MALIDEPDFGRDQGRRFPGQKLTAGLSEAHLRQITVRWQSYLAAKLAEERTTPHPGQLRQVRKRKIFMEMSLQVLANRLNQGRVATIGSHDTTVCIAAYKSRQEG